MSNVNIPRALLLGLVATFSVCPSAFAAEPSATVSEFYNVDLKHYFLTADPAEANGIDHGSAGAGWVRTGASFSAYANAADAVGLAAVCRFYGTPGVGPNSHFYTADAGECNQTKKDPGWTFEGIAYYILPLQQGSCPDATETVYRSYNNGYASNNSNHRYLTDYTLFSHMAALGFAPEGPVMCAPLSLAQRRADANRLLQQASFGPNAADVQHLLDVGVASWLDEQFAAAQSLYPPFPYVSPSRPASCVDNSTPPISASSFCQRDNYSLFQTQLQFFRNALSNPDQLRQRVAFALAQILVTSGVENSLNYAMAGYQQLLLANAFGNYEDILKSVTLSAMMGDYLNMANNDKPDASKGYSPNENYARELMQLFSIGLVALAPDGTPLLDAQGNTIPTYDQSVVTNLAHVLTGWTYPAPPGTAQSPVNFNTSKTYTGPLVPLESRHDSSAKILLGGTVVPPGLAARSDLNGAVHLIFMHPNVGPFIGRRLIQHLVNGNPTPGYVARVAARFNDNGKGVRGDMKAVIAALLLDPEARGALKLDPLYGKLREPILFMTALARALNVTSDGVYFQQQSGSLGQPLFYSPTVFNYFSPDYVVPGTTALGPEFGLLDSGTAITRINLANSLLFGQIAANANVYGATGTQLNWSPLQALAGNPGALADYLSGLLLNGTMSATLRAAIVSAVSAVAASDTLTRARTAVYLVAASPQFQVER